MSKLLIRFSITVAAVIVALILYDTFSPRGSRSAKKGYILIQGLQQAQYLKIQVMEYYMMKGVFPESNSDIGMPDTGYGDDIKQIEIVEGGNIVITYNRSSGINNGQLLLSPDEGLTGFDWNCITHDYISIDRWIPQCEYLVK